MLGGGNGVSSWSVHDDDPVGIGRIAIDIVNADSGSADGLELGCRRENLRRDLGLGADDEGIVVSNNLDEFLGRKSHLEVGGDVRMGIEKLNSLFGNRVGNQNAAWHNAVAVA